MKPTRMKAWTADHQLIVLLNHDLLIASQAELLAVEFKLKVKWDDLIVTGFGMLPNGDYVATLGYPI